jgi:Glycosyltransferase family 87
MMKRLPTLQEVAEFLIVAVCTVTFAFTSMGIFASLFGSRAAGSRDFVEYWAAGHQLVHHADPYDSDAILKLERSAGFPSDAPTLVMGNPPSALLLILPLGEVGPMAGELLWELLLLASLVASVRMVRSLQGHPKNLLHLLGYAFAPALSCLLAGQVSLFVLLGFVLFLRLHGSQPFLAGASLWLCFLKPQLFLPFGVVLLVWIVFTRNYKIVAGAAFAIGVSSALVTFLDPQVWTQYAQMMSTAHIDRILMPCVAALLRFYVPPHTFWLQCLPAALGCLWALVYFMKRRNVWNWVEDGSLLMLVSVFVAPYIWFMDQAVLIPALLYGLYSTRSRTLVAVLALISAVIEIEILRGLPLLHSFYYLWTAPAFLVWYLFATRTRHANHVLDLVPVAGAEP